MAANPQGTGAELQTAGAVAKNCVVLSAHIGSLRSITAVLKNAVPWHSTSEKTRLTVR